MQRIVEGFWWEGDEYRILRKEDRPIIVKWRYLKEAILEGAEAYPTVCNLDFECWLEIPDEHIPKLHEEMDGVVKK